MNLHNMHIASAVQKDGGRSNVNLNREWLGTSKIGQIVPIFHQACVPGDKFRIHISSFSRFLPLGVPSYVDLTYRTLSVFVPYHQVFDGVESFFSNQKTFRGQKNDIPMFSNIHLNYLFSHYASLTQVLSESATDGDIYAEGRWRRFTAKGSYFVKLLHSLGYRWNKNLLAQTREFNFLPLLAFAHAYNSYLAYSPDVNTSALSKDLEFIKRSFWTNASASAGVVGAYLYHILSSILLTYEESFLSLCWRTPYYSQYVSPTAPLSVDFAQLGSGNSLPVVPVVDYDGETGAETSADSSGILNAAQMRLLLKFDDFFRRSNYAGSKDIEQIYSRFGVKIDDYKTRYPYFLNETAQRVQIGDVTSTADTPNVSVVGSYAGKAISSDDVSFDFDCHDYGMLFTFAWFAPKPVYYLGCDKENLRALPFDFYTPELDQGFPSPVTRRQVDAEGLGNAPDSVFGYAPLYSEYLYEQSVICGDFEKITGFEQWHFGRNFDLDHLAQADSFIYMPQTGTPLERIFNVADPTLVDVDSIYTVCHISCSAIRPMKDFVGKTGLGEGSIDVPQLGYQAN